MKQLQHLATIRSHIWCYLTPEKHLHLCHISLQRHIATPERERNIISLTWAEQIRTSCRSRAKSGPLTLRARAMISPWAGKQNVVVLSLGFVGLKEPPDKTSQLNRLELSRPSQVPQPWGGPCIFIRCLVAGSDWMVCRGEELQCKRHQ